MPGGRLRRFCGPLLGLCRRHRLRRPLRRHRPPPPANAAGAVRVSHIALHSGPKPARSACGWRVGSTSSHNRSNTSSSCSAPGCAGGGWSRSGESSRSSRVTRRAPPKRSSSFEPPARSSGIPSSQGLVSARPSVPRMRPPGPLAAAMARGRLERARSVLLDFRTCHGESPRRSH